MTLRSDISALSGCSLVDDEKARLIIGYLYGTGILDPVWLDDDPEMLADIDRSEVASCTFLSKYDGE